MPTLNPGSTARITLQPGQVVSINSGLGFVVEPGGSHTLNGGSELIGEFPRVTQVEITALSAIDYLVEAGTNLEWKGSGAAPVVSSTTEPVNIEGYNSLTIYEEFDKSLGDVFSGAMTGITTGTTANAGMTATFTTTAIQSDLAGINGAMYYNSGANQAASSQLRYVLHGNSPGRMVSMFRHGFRAEMRFALESDQPNRVVQFGWFSRSGALTADGMPGGAGTLIVGQTVYLIRRDVDAGIQRKDEIATLATGKVYTISADTTSGQLVHTITNNTDGVVVDTRTVPKWTGFVNMVNDMDLFGSAPSNAKFQVFFGVCGGVHALTVPAITRLLTLDAFYVHCPKMR